MEEAIEELEYVPKEVHKNGERKKEVEREFKVTNGRLKSRV